MKRKRISSRMFSIISLLLLGALLLGCISCGKNTNDYTNGNKESQTADKQEEVSPDTDETEGNSSVGNSASTEDGSQENNSENANSSVETPNFIGSPDFPINQAQPAVCPICQGTGVSGGQPCPECGEPEQE